MSAIASLPPLHAEVFGPEDPSSPNIVLLHGWGVGSAIWRPVVAQLAKTARVHVPDLPGYGGSPRLAGDDQIDQLIDRLMAALPEKVTLAGWSLGGLIALGALGKYPKRIERLALVGSTACFLRRTDWPHGVAPDLLSAFESALQLSPSMLLKRFAVQINEGDAQARTLSKLASNVIAEQTPDPLALKDGVVFLRQLDWRALLPCIPHPVWVLAGERDPLMLPAAQAALAAQLPNAQQTSYPECAHLPFLAQTDRFVSELLAFSGATA